MPTRDPRGRTLDWLDRRERAKGLRPRFAAAVIVVLWLAAVVIWGVVEHLIDKDTFPTVWLGMWWALQTVTTVGYGDIVPQSDAGRAVATLLLLGGLAFLSVVTAVITSSFVARRQQEIHDEGNDPIIERLDRLHERLDAIEGVLREPGPPARVTSGQTAASLGLVHDVASRPASSAGSSSIATRSCSSESRSRTVTVRFSSDSWSIVTHHGVPISSWRR